MVSLSKLKVLALRLGYSQSSSSSIVASTFKRFVSGDPKPSHFPLQHQLLLCRHFTSETSENHNDFTVNYLISSCGLSPEDAISASKRVKLRSPERPDYFLSFLRNHGFSATQISKMVRSYPRLFQLHPERTILPKLEFFTSLGVSKEELAKSLAYQPKLLTTSLNNRILPTYDFLRSLISKKNVASVFKHGSRIFKDGHSKNVAPNIEILKESGMPYSCISLLLAHHPKVLMVKREEIVKVVDEVKQLGFNLQKSTSVPAIKALCGSNRSACNRNRQVYKRWGWSEDDLVSAFRRHPVCMIVSEKKLMLAMEFLVNKMGWPSVMIAKSPEVMCYSLEKRFIPRCLVVKVLLLKGLIKGIENVSLSSLVVPVEKLFLERYVARYIDQVPQLLSVYRGKVEVWDV
ncbi:transcription termination factor MTERF2, chloroplastic-like [Pyrus communis]|uniref:transcription termination factor MTERF2, chloroplastic-like n=1 Tax=Pyrus communis TaxID=23211 RepID=UPI0035C240CA